LLLSTAVEELCSSTKNKSYSSDFPFWLLSSFQGWQLQPYFVYISDIC